MPRGKPEKYTDISKKIERCIRANGLRDGTRLPSERELSEKYNCNHLTLRKALRLLEQNGIIHKVPSVGNFTGPYHPDQEETGLIGIIFPDDDLYYFRLLTRLGPFFEHFRLFPIVKLTNHAAVKEDETLEFFSTKNVRAVISVPNTLCAKQYEKLRCPVIFFDHYPENSRIPHVISDDFSGAFSAVDYLYSLGHHKIACIGSMFDRASAKRSEGYLAALKKREIKPQKKYLKIRDLSREWGFQSARELFALPEPPTAIFCGNDTAAAGVFRYCSSAGIRIPEDVSLIGFGNTEIADDLFLTSVSQHSDRIAQAIANNLSLLMEGKPVPQETLIPENLIIRNSAAPVR